MKKKKYPIKTPNGIILEPLYWRIKTKKDGKRIIEIISKDDMVGRKGN